MLRVWVALTASTPSPSPSPADGLGSPGPKALPFVIAGLAIFALILAFRKKL